MRTHHDREEEGDVDAARVDDALRLKGEAERSDASPQGRRGTDGARKRTKEDRSRLDEEREDQVVDDRVLHGLEQLQLLDNRESGLQLAKGQTLLLEGRQNARLCTRFIQR